MKGDIHGVNAVKGDFTLGDVIESGHKVAEGALSTAGRANQGKGLACLDGQGEIGDDLAALVLGRVAEGNLIKNKVALDIGDLGFAIVDLLLGIHDLAESTEAAHTLLQLLEEGDEALNGI